MQLYRILKERPELFGSIKYSLHLPQYCSYLLTGNPVSDITSIGCHTNLWNYGEQRYHAWVYRAGLIEKLAPIVSSDTVFPLVAVQQEGGTEGVAAATAGRSGEWSGSDPVLVGVGLHDSSAAIIPYLESYRDPFVLISTGTWCITMNPFNDSPLTAAELQQDCLCYLSYKGRPVKASRLFAGRDHEVQVRRLVAYFHREPESAATVGFDPACVERLRAASPVKGSVFGRRELKAFESFEEAYHCLMMDIMDQQVVSTGLVLRGTGVRRIFVDGGFGRNEVYMRLLAAAFPEMEVSAATIPQATAMGAALAIHAHWNDQVLPRDLIELKSYR
jgi:sugar (pentulose or hexulose) kinase